MVCPFCLTKSTFKANKPEGALAPVYFCPDCGEQIPALYVREYRNYPPVVINAVGFRQHGKTLYFASDYHPGFGGLDLYMTKHVGADTALLRLRVMALREAAMQVEEEMEVKFMDVNEYNEKQQELNNVTPLLEKKKAELTSKTEELEKLRKEIDPLKKEFETVFNDPKNPIKLWCGDCNWPRGGPKKSCDSRLEFTMDTYGVAVIEGKIAIMKDGRCKKSE